MVIKLIQKPIILLSTSTCFIFGACQPAKNIQPPNIILVFADDLGYGDLGCYGQKLIKTPNIDQMAQDGILLTDFYSAAPVCAPSRCSLITGKHAGHAFIRHNVNQLPLGQLPIPEEEVTIAELLKQAGYSTAAFGKWGMGSLFNEGDPLKQGFDHFYGYYCQCKAHNYYPEMLWNDRDTVRLRNEVVPVNVNFIDYPLSYATQKVDFSPNLVFDDLLRFVEKNKANPFFLYYATTLPHSNGEAPADEKFEVPDWGIYQDSTWLPAEKGYASMITILDRQVGQIIAKLKELNLAENTIVIFTSDNGPTLFAKRFESAGELKGRKRDLYEGGIREPFVAWWPGKIPAGLVSEQPTATYDFLPTFCELSGVEIPGFADGQSLLPLLKGETFVQERPLYWEFYEGEGSPKQALRKGDWKLIRNYFNQPEKQALELYNLKNDQQEAMNVADENPEIVKELIAVMDQEHKEYVNINFQPK